MTIHDTFAGAQYITRMLDIIADKGVMIEIGTDFDLYASYIAEHRTKLPLGLAFDPEVQKLTEDTGFWIAGWDSEGKMMHSQAMRMIDMSNTYLSDYLSEYFQRFAPPGYTLDMSRSLYRPGPGAKRITGRICYHGDLWVESSDRYRGTGLPGILARFALATSLLRWSPDHVFGFMAQHHAFRGLAEREGYMHCEPGALELHTRELNTVIRGFLTYMSREDLNFLMEICPREFVMSQAA